MIPEKQRKAFKDFYESALHNTAIDERTSIMIGAATSMALGCYPCMKNYFEKAEKAGITGEELGAVRAIVMAVSAGKVMAQSSDLQQEA